MAILHVVDTWKPYFLVFHFKIKTNHHSLKYFLEQCLSFRKQQKWVTKMLRYDYEIIIKMEKVMSWLILSLDSMKMKHPCYLFLHLSLIG